MGLVLAKNYIADSLVSHCNVLIYQSHVQLQVRGCHTSVLIVSLVDLLSNSWIDCEGNCLCCTCNWWSWWEN